MKSRIDYIDRLKELAIFLVVMGMFMEWLFAYQMTYFISLSIFPHAVVYVPFWIGCLFCYKTSLLELK